jgi:hypothetical protein
MTVLRFIFTIAAMGVGLSSCRKPAEPPASSNLIKDSIPDTLNAVTLLKSTRDTLPSAYMQYGLTPAQVTAVEALLATQAESRVATMQDYREYAHVISNRHKMNARHGLPDAPFKPYYAEGDLNDDTFTDFFIGILGRDTLRVYWFPALDSSLSRFAKPRLITKAADYDDRQFQFIDAIQLSHKGIALEKAFDDRKPMMFVFDSKYANQFSSDSAESKRLDSLRRWDGRIKKVSAVITED